MYVVEEKLTVSDLFGTRYLTVGIRARALVEARHVTVYE